MIVVLFIFCTEDFGFVVTCPGFILAYLSFPGEGQQCHCFMVVFPFVHCGSGLYLGSTTDISPISRTGF